MGVGDARQRDSRAERAGRPTFDLVTSKLRRPVLRPGTVRRSSLIERLERGDPRPIVSVVAPAGYGKTTLLSQWAERNGQAFAWVSVDEADNDPKVLLRYVAEALDAVEPIGDRVFDALASTASSVPGSVVPRLGSAFAAMTTPVVLVLDDVHLLHNRECRAALSVLADHVPAGSRLAFAGRDEPPLRVARLRAEGRVLEIGPGDLSLTCGEAEALLRAAEVVLGEDDVAELHRRTEGWAAGLYLAALYLREGGALPGAVVSFGGRDRLVAEYVESEFLERISRRQREFLTRTAVLERLSGPLCEAVLDLPGSRATLADLAKSNLLLVPLDRQGEWYRYHHLFRDMLLAELERREPGLVPVLRRRAAGWFLRQRPARGRAGVLHRGRGRRSGRSPGAADSGCPPTGKAGWPPSSGGSGGWKTAARSRVTRCWPCWRRSSARRWGRRSRRSGGPTWSIAGSTPARPGPMTPPPRRGPPYCGPACAGAGSSRCAPMPTRPCARCAREGILAPAAVLLQGTARVLCGDLDGGDAYLEDAASGAQDVGAHEVLAAALCERSLLAMTRNDWDRAGILAEQAGTTLSRTRIEDSYVTPLVCAVQARAAVHRRDLPAARQQLAQAQRLRALLTYALPHVAVQARIELARVHIALTDLAGARTLMREADELLRRRPGLGTLAGEAGALRAWLSGQRSPGSTGTSALTAAELRLLPLLTTHLSFPEIAQELSLSPHTVKSQAWSIYRKLGASSRSQMIARSRELGLLEE